MSGPITREASIRYKEIKTSRGKLTYDSLRDQHVVQSHKLRIRRVVVLDIPQAEHGALLYLAEDTEEGRLHAVAVERMLSSLKDKESNMTPTPTGPQFFIATLPHTLHPFLLPEHGTLALVSPAPHPVTGP